ncbi:MAG: hypothetical protein KGR69_07125 [Verrucomicrobia bacterium]|nr:hypothetical protein [Verrucomicrobiota bacterium]
MARGLFVIGFTAAEVLQIQAKAKELLLEGKTLMSWGESGSTASKQFAMPVAEVLEECAYALPILDPETHGRPPRRVGATRVGFLPK